METRWDENPDAIFGCDFIGYLTPIPGRRGVPKTIPDNGSLEIHQFRVFKGCKPFCDYFSDSETVL